MILYSLTCSCNRDVIQHLDSKLHDQGLCGICTVLVITRDNMIDRWQLQGHPHFFGLSCQASHPLHELDQCFFDQSGDVNVYAWLQDGSCYASNHAPCQAFYPMCVAGKGPGVV